MIVPLKIFLSFSPHFHGPMETNTAAFAASLNHRFTEKRPGHAELSHRWGSRDCSILELPEIIGFFWRSKENEALLIWSLEFSVWVDQPYSLIDVFILDRFPTLKNQKKNLKNGLYK